MIFRQLFEPRSSTYTYLLGCAASGEALLIDPVIETLERDLSLLEALGLRLVCTLETHVHADHLTAAWALRRRTGCRVAYPEAERVACADLQVNERGPIVVGTLHLQALHTPGHTPGGQCYLLADREPPLLFSGDVLLIDGCGRTDLDGGDATALYASIHAKVLTLPEDTLVYPGHDYNGRRVTTIGQEIARNPRVGSGRTQGEFIAIMSRLDLPYPAKIDIAVPANRRCDNPAHCGPGSQSRCGSAANP